MELAGIEVCAANAVFSGPAESDANTGLPMIWLARGFGSLSVVTAKS